MDKTINSVSIRKKCRGGYLAFNTTKKYMNIVCDKNGFDFHLSDEPQEDCIVRVKTSYGKFRLPLRILQAYMIGDEVHMLKYGEDQYYIFGASVCKDPPKPFPGYMIKDDSELPDPSKAVLFENIVVNNGYEDRYGDMRVNLSEEFEKMNIKKITLHIGEQQFIEISKATESDIERFIPSEIMYQEFGRNLQDFIGESITYIAYHKANTHFRIPAIFYKKAGIDLKNPVRVYKMPDGRIIIAPPVEKCFIDDEEIDPIKQKPIIKEICNECAENDNMDTIKDLVRLVKNLAAKCERILTSKEEERKTYQAMLSKLNDEKKDLTNRINKIEEKVDNSNKYKDAFSGIANIIKKVNDDAIEIEFN